MNPYPPTRGLGYPSALNTKFLLSPSATFYKFSSQPVLISGLLEPGYTLQKLGYTLLSSNGEMGWGNGIWKGEESNESRPIFKLLGLSLSAFSGHP